MPSIVSNAKTDPLAACYGLRPMPESIARLTKLVAQQDTDLEQIGQLIDRDKAMTGRLLRLANPRSTSEEDYGITTVEEALMRTGLAPVILLAMLDPLTRAVLDAFTMFFTPLTEAGLQAVQPLAGEHVVATVRFAGKGTGLVQLRLGLADAAHIAKAVLGDAAITEQVNDVIGELANIIGGNLESSLCDAGITCKLTTPVVCRATEFHKAATSGGVCERLAFEGSGLTAFVDVSVNPWSD